MAADLKPGDRVRDTRVWTVEAVNGDSAHLSLDGHTRLAGTHYLEPVSAAPASEPEMRWEIARTIMLARDNGGCEVIDWEREARDNPHVQQAVRQADAIIAHHLAKRDARIEELEAEVHALCSGGDDDRAEVRQAWWAREHAARKAAEARTRAAEAALAEEREANAKLADAERMRCLAHFNLATSEKARDLWVVCCDTARVIAEAIRSRTITAEGADTGSAEHAR